MTDTQKPEIVVALRQISRAMDVYSRSLQATVGLTSPQLATLAVVGQLEPISAGDIAREIHLSHATVTGILDRLEKRNLVIRWRSESDRRSVLVRLTSEGKTVLVKAPPLLQPAFSDQFANLAEWERNQIVAVLQRVVQMMDTTDAPPSAASDRAETA